MTTEAFASFSDTAIMFAGIVYVLALAAHVAEWVVALTTPARSGGAEGAAAQPVVVGADGSRIDGPAAGAGSGSLPERPADAGDERRELRIDTASRIGVALTVVAAVLHTAGVVTRSFASDPWRVPWGNMYEFTLTGALGVTLIYLVLLRTLRLRWMGLFLTLFQVVVLMLANLTLEQQAGPLVPALHSYWLVIHVGAAILATGAFAVGALTSVMFLVKLRMGERRAALLDRFPDADTLDRISYRLHAVGFPLWTFAALIAGPIWAEYAWGSYWNWDPKEVWAFITWVVYAAYLHARATAGWKGKAAAIIALIGFATLLFNFVGINFFFGASSLHSYAGS
ncbi:c-type cytochrome biogenesis protein CcsB [Nocardioides sp. HDW12B]|uniref:c-type cytochrome biogenesis protein CcsB n=1 Tax=Nocardioides sp. HDW12B TaxID=2714939 RepID=UPI0014096FBA|nr:c-type cytochrome biogenesis protein CcsB [Nocardioides sp. HDW12B]QIK65136.1 c-type cytochrome biogenesis protein CcsB [Nocardioides sp. HDW12B]